MAHSSAFRLGFFPGPSLLYLILLAFTDVALGAQRFDTIDGCRDRVIQANATSPWLNLTFQLDLPQCLEYCGYGYGPYDKWTIINGIISWVLPLFLILSNVTYAKSSSEYYRIWGINMGSLANWLAVMCHLLVNPIDFIYTLSIKLDIGREIKDRVDRIPGLSETLRKSASAVFFALDDFKNGHYIDILLRPMENTKDPETRNIAIAHFTLLQDILEQAARDLSDARRHNKLSAVLAVIIYVKEVVEALLAYESDKNFPYHMPHTLALRQLYYWIFLAIVLSSALGGFASQWTSQSILRQFLRRRSEILKENQIRYENITLESVQPWDGGNYSWRYPKGEHTDRRRILLALAFLAVLIPCGLASAMSWFTPTQGLGDRSILELAYTALWLLNWGITNLASRCLKGQTLFRIMWWNLFLSLATLIVLFAAFQGWFNNCQSWMAYFSRGSAAVLDLNMRDVEEGLIYKFYLPMVVCALAIQLGLAGTILGMNRSVLMFMDWRDHENRAFFNDRAGDVGKLSWDLPKARGFAEEMQMTIREGR